MILHTNFLGRLVMNGNSFRPRGIRVSEVIAGWGRVLNVNAEVDPHKLLLMSQPSERLDFFFSHVWSSNPRSRYLGIVWYLSSRSAGILTICLVAMACGILAEFVDGRLWVKFEASTILTAQSIMALSGTAVMLILLLTEALVSEMIARGRRVCFLDRCCIDQVDADEKLKGIRQIPLTLAHTRQLVVLLSDSYFTRLWCCYELAVFRSGMRPGNRIDIIPLRVVSLTVLMLLFDLVSVVLFRSGIRSSMSQDDDLKFTIISAVFSSSVAVLAYAFSFWWYQDRERFKAELASFSLANAKCTDESDRAILAADIGRRFNGVENFEKYVTTELLAEVSLRPQFKYMLFMSLPSLLAVIAYVNIMPQRMGLFCMTQLDAERFHRKDDLFCTVLDRSQWVNGFVIIAELIRCGLYYPVLIGSVIWYCERMAGMLARWPTITTKLAMHAVGVATLAVAITADNFQYEDVVIFRSVEAGLLLLLATIFYLLPVIREGASGHNRHSFMHNPIAVTITKSE